MNPLSRSGRSGSSQPPQHINGPEADKTKASGERIQVITDVQPIMVGTDLGRQLRPTGLRLLKLIFHPKTAYDLLTGKLSHRRQTNPERYLAEIADLCHKPKDWANLLGEVKTLRALHDSQLPAPDGSQVFHQQEDQCYAHLGKHISHFKKHLSSAGMVDHLSMVADLIKECDGLPWKAPQPELGFQQLSNRLESTLPDMDKGDLKEAISHLDTITTQIDGFAQTPLDDLLDEAKRLQSE